jgi:hypothetical protein
MFLAALRRFLVLTVGVSVITGLAALLFGEALNSTPARAVSVAFYAVGSFAMLVGVFVGSRGPIRMKSEETGSGFALPFFGVLSNRTLRWATLSEQHESINNSAVFVAVGFVLLVIGILIDPRHKLF